MALFDFKNYGTEGETPIQDSDIVFHETHNYADPSNSDETRKQLSTPLFQLKKFINSLFDANGKMIPSNLPAASESAAGTMSATDKAKLNGIESGAEANVIETVKVEGTALTPSSKEVNIQVSDFPTATTSSAGIMSSTDKTKLDGVDTGAQVNVIETVKINGTALAPSDKAVNIPNATNSSSGLMTSDEKIKLATIDQGAQVNVIETVQLNGSSLTPLNKTVDITILKATQGWDGLMPKEDKKKLDNATSEIAPLKPANLVKRDSNGRFRAEAPSDSKDVANKAYVDEHDLPDPTNYPEGTVMVVYADYYGVKHWTAMQLWNDALTPIKPEPLPPE